MTDHDWSNLPGKKNMAMHQLSSETVRLLSSSQVITSVHAVVKELLENSLDSKATNIEIKLENYGLDLIEVRDNGTGIKKEDTPYMALPHYTSKLTNMDDLTSLDSYGFRGEALTSVAAISNLGIITCTEMDDVALMYTIDHSGQVIATKPSHLGRGTTISVTNLFKNIPVRKQYYKNSKHCKEDLKKVEDIVLSFGITHPQVRFVLKHNKSIIWQKMQTSDFKINLQLVLGSTIMQQLVPITFQHFDPMLKIQGYIPKRDADLTLVSRTTADKLFLIVNNRPVAVKPVIQLIRQAFVDAFPSQCGRYPVAVICIDVLPADIDVNLEPNKTTVLFHNMEFIASSLSSLLSQVYSSLPVEVHHDEEDVSERTPPLSTRASCSHNETPGKEARLDCSSDLQVHKMDALDTMDIGGVSHDQEGAPLFSSSPDHNAQAEDSHGSGVGSELLACSAHGDGSVSDPRKQHASPEGCGDQNASVVSSGTVDGSLACFSSPQEISCDSENGRLLQPESYELLDISDFEEDVDDYRSDTTSLNLHKAGVIPSAVDTDKPSLIQDCADLSGEDSTATSQQQGSLLEWSRGEAIKSSSEKIVEPVVVLKPPVRPLVSSTAAPTPKPVQSKLAYKGPSPIYDLINSKPVKRKATNQPSSGDVSSSNKKRKYTPPPACGALPSLLDKFKLRLKKKDSDASNVMSRTVACNLSEITERSIALSSSKTPPELPDAVIGCCNPPGVWMVLFNKDIACFNAFKASQSVLYRKLFASHVLPQECLGSPIKLNESMLGGSGNLSALLSLKTEQNPLDGCYHFCDHQLTKNGFEIQQTLVDGHPCLRLTHMCVTLPSYGLQDLRELLGKIRTSQDSMQHGTSPTICRPTAVEQFLKRESTRMAKAQFPLLQKCNIEDLFADLLSKQGETNISVYFHNICSLSDD